VLGKFEEMLRGHDGFVVLVCALTLGEFRIDLLQIRLPRVNEVSDVINDSVHLALIEGISTLDVTLVYVYLAGVKQ
jgi:hypothetical protein